MTVHPEINAWLECERLFKSKPPQWCEEEYSYFLERYREAQKWFGEIHQEMRRADGQPSRGAISNGPTPDYL